MIKPQKLDNAEAIKKVQTTAENRPGSAWNAGTTWEHKNLKVDQIKTYLESQNLIFAENETCESKLLLKTIKKCEGEASIAVVRGEPKMGYELTLKAIFEGVEGTYLQDMTCTLKVEGICDDGAEPESFKFNVKSCLDTEQGTQAKKCLGYDNECDNFCKVIR